jgi:hypothetical protein
MMSPYPTAGYVGLRTGTGKPAVPDKRVSRVRVRYHIWSTWATPRTRVTVSRVWTVFLGVHKALRYFFKYCHENLFADQGPPGSYSFFKNMKLSCFTRQNKSVVTAG